MFELPFCLESSSKLEVSRKHPCREPFHGHPHHVVPVKSAEEICSGDHILFQVTEPPFRAKFRSALVVQPSYCIEIIMNCEDGVVKTSIPFHQLTPLYKVIYQTPLYDGKTSIERAEFRLKLKEKCYHVLNNNSHFFVTWCTTGRESSLTDILRALESQPTSKNAYCSIRLVSVVLNSYPQDSRAYIAIQLNIANPIVN